MPPARTDRLMQLGMLIPGDPRWMNTSISPVGVSRAVSNSSRAATILAFDVLMRAGSPFLTNQRVFAYPAHGVPMRIACDETGNVYVGCGNGLQIWSPGGVILGVLEVPGSYRPLRPRSPRANPQRNPRWRKGILLRKAFRNISLLRANALDSQSCAGRRAAIIACNVKTVISPLVSLDLGGVYDRVCQD